MVVKKEREEKKNKKIKTIVDHKKGKKPSETEKWKEYVVGTLGGINSNFHRFRQTTRRRD